MNGSNRPNDWLLRRRALTLALLFWIGLPTPVVIAGVLEPGDLVVADRFHGLFRVDPITGQKLLLSSGGLLDRYIGGVAINSDGMLFATVASTGGSWGRGRVVKVDPDTGEQELLVTSLHLASPGGVTIDRSGNPLVAAGSWKLIIRVAADTGIQFPLIRAGVTQFAHRILLDACGDLISDGVGYLARADLKTGNQTIISKDRKISPRGMAFDANDDLIVLGRLPGPVATGEIVRMDPFTGEATQLTSLGFLRDPGGLAVGLDGAIFFGTTGPPPQGPLEKFEELVRVDPDTYQQTVLTTFFRIEDIAVVQPPTHKGERWLKRKRCLKRKKMSAYGQGY